MIRKTPKKPSHRPKTEQSGLPRRQTLYEVHLWDAMSSAIESLHGRTRLTTSLNKRATRSIMLLATPADIPNRRLLDILTGEPPNSHSEAESDSLVRHFRKLGGERTLKIENARSLILRLLIEGFIPKSEAVRVWYYALIQYAAISVVVEEFSKLSQEARSSLGGNEDQANEMMTKAHSVMGKVLDKYLGESNRLYEAGDATGEHQQFLDFGTLLYTDGAIQAEAAFSGYRKLIAISEKIEDFVFD